MTAGATGTASGEEWPDLDDPYYDALADELASAGLPAGEFVYGDDETEALAAYEPIGALETEPIDVGDEVPFSSAVRLHVGPGTEDPWDALFKGDVEERGIEPDSTLLGVVSLRAAPGSDGDATARYTSKDRDNTADDQVVNPNQPDLGETWERYYFHVDFGYASDPGDWWTEFMLGFGEQTVDLGGVALIDFGQQVTTDALPDWEPDYDYDGREPDAAWRARARDRIESIRTGPLTVRVVDPDGDPIEGAEVDVQMREHEFGFGSAIAVDSLRENETYREVFLEYFNEAVVENGLKWPAWDGQWGDDLGPEATMDAVSWLDDHSVPTRGHALLWATYDRVPVDEDAGDREVIDAFSDSIEERATAVADEVDEWDAHNHPVMLDEVIEDVGRDPIPHWWSVARDADPDAPMYVNEGRVLSAANGLRDEYYEYVEWLRENGVEVDGIGFMGHFGLDYLRPPTQLLEDFDRFASFDVPLKLTEFDVTLNDIEDETERAARRDYFRDVLIAAFSHEAIESVLQWGFWAGDHVEPVRAMFDEEWNLRPHGEVYRDLVFDEWWTDERGVTDGDGSFETAAFLGRHDVTVSTEGASRTATVSVTDAEEGATVRIPVAAGQDPCESVDAETAAVDGGTVCDLDGDGTFRDVTGDGELGQDDVVHFFENQHRDAWKRPDLFDFSNSDSVGHSDVIALFERVATGP